MRRTATGRTSCSLRSRATGTLRGGDAAAEPRKVFLQEIRVRGFRGIGPESTLSIAPGPGLTLVVGRNGCGKSSFAEAAELLVTRRNLRWEDRQAGFFPET